MWICHKTSLLLGIWMLLLLVTYTIAINCSLDDDQTNPELDRCLVRGEAFAFKYEKAIKKSKQFDKCQEYREFGNCLRPMLQRCPNLNTTLHHKWKTILYTMDVACGQKESLANLECMENQYHSIYSQMCRDLYSFNILQNTHGKCRFVREKLDCEQSLIASACGEPVGHMFISLMKATIKKEKCLVPHMYHTHKTKHFRYNNHCPVNITESIGKCTDKYPKESVLQFMELNDLIVDGRRKQIKKSCSHYANYSTCVKDVTHTCPDGINKILEFNSKQRSHQLKMDYICFEKKREYLDSIYCYQDIMKNDLFEKCTAVWSQLNSKLENITSYLFYCDKSHPASQALQRELVRLQECYEGVVRQSCDDTAATTLGGLIAKAFNDPKYLRLRYIPDCSLHTPHTSIHSTTTVEVPAKTTPSSHNKHYTVNTDINKSNHHNKNNVDIQYKVTVKLRPVSGSAVPFSGGLSKLFLFLCVLFIRTIIGGFVTYQIR